MNKKVFLNHIYAIIDANIYDEIIKSSFLKEYFCHLDEKTNSNGIASWTGIYLTEENTYIELFSNKDKTNHEGECGVAFSVDHEKEFEEIIQLFQRDFCNNINHGLFKRDNLVPWFYYLEFKNNFSTKPQLETWIMSYHKDYLKYKSINYSDINGFTRKLYNKTCNTVPHDENKLFKDIEEITLLLDDENKKKFTEQLILLGYNCQETENYVVCSGPDITFKLKSFKDKACKLLQLQISLNRKINNIEKHKIGNSFITLENQKATWNFYN